METFKKRRLDLLFNTSLSPSVILLHFCTLTLLSMSTAESEPEKVSDVNWRWCGLIQ